MTRAPPGFESEANLQTNYLTNTTVNSAVVVAAEPQFVSKRQSLSLSKGPHLAKGPGWCIPFSARCGQPTELIGEKKGEQIQPNEAEERAVMHASPVLQAGPVVNLHEKRKIEPKSDPVITFRKTTRYAHEAASRAPSRYSAVPNNAVEVEQSDMQPQSGAEQAGGTSSSNRISTHHDNMEKAETYTHMGWWGHFMTIAHVCAKKSPHEHTWAKQRLLTAAAAVSGLAMAAASVVEW